MQANHLDRPVARRDEDAQDVYAGPGRADRLLLENPGTITASCTSVGDRTFLAIAVKPVSAAADTLARALVDLDSRGPHWGLHPLDVSLARRLRRNRRAAREGVERRA
jgi:hypothetical protein